MRAIYAILRLTHEQGLSVREVSERLKISKTTVSTYLLGRGRPGCHAGLCRRATTTRHLSGCCLAVPVVRRKT